MCCGFVCSSLLAFCNLDFLLLSTLFILPVYGLTAGVDTILRVSLLLSLLCILSHLLPNAINYIYLQPFSQVGLFAVLWGLPVKLLPYSVVWVYSVALQITGPILLLQEVLFVIVLATDLFNYLSDLAEEDYDNSIVYNGIVTAFSLLFYTVGLYVSFTHFSTSWVILVIVLVSLLNCFLMWLSGCGWLWESGFTFLISALIFLAMNQELQLEVDINDLSETLSALNPRDSIVEFIFSLWFVTVDKFQQLLTWLYYFLTPMFITSFMVRLFSVNWVIHKMPSLSDECDDVEVDIIEEENSWFKRRSALICKLCTIFVLTQLISDQFYELAGQGPLFQRHWLKSWFPDQILIGRISQIVLANITLQHSIYRRWQEGDTRNNDHYS